MNSVLFSFRTSSVYISYLSLSLSLSLSFDLTLNERLGWVLNQYKWHLSFAESISYHANFRFQFSTFPEGTGICVIIFSIQHVMSLCNIL